jgi:hypothetical protein
MYGLRIFSKTGAALTADEINAAHTLANTFGDRNVGVVKATDAATGVEVEYHSYKRFAFVKSTSNPLQYGLFSSTSPVPIFRYRRVVITDDGTKLVASNPDPGEIPASVILLSSWPAINPDAVDSGNVMIDGQRVFSPVHSTVYSRMTAYAYPTDDDPSRNLFGVCVERLPAKPNARVWSVGSKVHSLAVVPVRKLVAISGHRLTLEALQSEVIITDGFETPTITLVVWNTYVPRTTIAITMLDEYSVGDDVWQDYEPVPGTYGTVTIESGFFIAKKLTFSGVWTSGSLFVFGTFIPDGNTNGLYAASNNGVVVTTEDEDLFYDINGYASDYDTQAVYPAAGVVVGEFVHGGTVTYEIDGNNITISLPEAETLLGVIPTITTSFYSVDLFGVANLIFLTPTRNGPLSIRFNDTPLGIEFPGFPFDYGESSPAAFATLLAGYVYFGSPGFEELVSGISFPVNTESIDIIDEALDTTLYDGIPIDRVDTGTIIETFQYKTFDMHRCQSSPFLVGYLCSSTTRIQITTVEPVPGEIYNNEYDASTITGSATNYLKRITFNADGDWNVEDTSYVRFDRQYTFNGAGGSEIDDEYTGIAEALDMTHSVQSIDLEGAGSLHDLYEVSGGRIGYTEVVTNSAFRFTREFESEWTFTSDFGYGPIALLSSRDAVFTTIGSIIVDNTNPTPYRNRYEALGTSIFDGVFADSPVIMQRISLTNYPTGLINASSGYLMYYDGSDSDGGFVNARQFFPYTGDAVSVITSESISRSDTGDSSTDDLLHTEDNTTITSVFVAPEHIQDVMVNEFKPAGVLSQNVITIVYVKKDTGFIQHTGIYQINDFASSNFISRYLDQEIPVEFAEDIDWLHDYIALIKTRASAIPGGNPFISYYNQIEGLCDGAAATDDPVEIVEILTEITTVVTELSDLVVEEKFSTYPMLEVAKRTSNIDNNNYNGIYYVVAV